MLKMYLAHNMHKLDEKETIENRKNLIERFKNNGFYVPWLYDLNDYKRDLLPDEIIARCLGIMSICDVFVMMDADEPGWGKMVEMCEAYHKNIPIYCICKDNDNSPWIKYYSTDIFNSVESLISFLKEKYESK